MLRCSSATFQTLVGSRRRELFQRTVWLLKFKASSSTTIRTVPAMGMSWSRTSDKNGETTSVWTSIDSKAVDRLYEPIAISTKLAAGTASQLRTQRQRYAWVVDFEVDVAYQQRRYKLCTVPADLSDDVQRIVVTPDMMRNMVDSNQVTVNDLCNICALHLSLESDEMNGESKVDICLVVDISRSDSPNRDDIAELRRRMYGYTNQTVQDEESYKRVV